MGRSKLRRRRGFAADAASKSFSTGSLLPGRKSALGPGSAFPWLILVLVSALAYFNAAPNVVVFDDQEFLAGGAFDNLQPIEFFSYFSQSLWEASGGVDKLYRPLLLWTLGLESLVFGRWWAGYHLVNIGLHVAAVLVVFGFVRLTLRRLGYPPEDSQWTALLASGVFGVHPVFTEVVNSIFNGSEIYATLCTVGALWYLLANQGTRPIRAWTLTGVLYLAGMLFRENAVVLPALAGLMLWTTSSGHWQTRVRRCLPVFLLLIPLAVYTALRVNALDPRTGLTNSTQASSTAALQQDTPVTPANRQGAKRSMPGNPVSRKGWDWLGVRVEPSQAGAATAVWADGMKLLVWPHPLVVLHTPSRTPVTLAVAVHAALLALALFAWWRGRAVFFTGLGFFYLAILPSSRIVSDGYLAPFLLERMLYLPSAGWVLILAGVLYALSRRVPTRWVVLTMMSAVVAAIPVTWARNADWGDEVGLLEGDLVRAPGSRQLLISTVKANAQAGQSNRAAALCDRAAVDFDKSIHLARECGKVYRELGAYGQSERAFLAAIERAPNQAWGHFELARLRIAQGRRNQAREHFEQALSNERYPFVREIMHAVMLLELWPHDPERREEARAHLESALELQPRSALARQLLAQLN